MYYLYSVYTVLYTTLKSKYSIQYCISTLLCAVIHEKAPPWRSRLQHRTWVSKMSSIGNLQSSVNIFIKLPLYPLYTSWRARVQVRGPLDPPGLLDLPLCAYGTQVVWPTQRYTGMTTTLFMQLWSYPASWHTNAMDQCEVQEVNFYHSEMQKAADIADISVLFFPRRC